MIDWTVMLSQGIALAVTLTYHMQRFVKPLLAAIFAVGAALLFKEKIEPTTPGADMASVRNAMKVEDMRQALMALYALWPYYVTIALATWLTAMTPLRFYSELWGEPLNQIMTGLTVAGGSGFIYDMANEVGKWREAVKGMGDVS